MASLYYVQLISYGEPILCLVNFIWQAHVLIASCEASLFASFVNHNKYKTIKWIRFFNKKLLQKENR